MRWLTGFTLAEGEEKVAGHSGQFLVGADDVILLTDSRYTVQAKREAPDATVDEIGYALADAWPRLLERIGARRVAVEATAVSQALWTTLVAAAPDVELVPAEPLAGGDAGRSRRRTRSSASALPARSRTGRSRRCSPRSIPA